MIPAHAVGHLPCFLIHHSPGPAFLEVYWLAAATTALQLRSTDKQTQLQKETDYHCTNPTVGPPAADSRSQELHAEKGTNKPEQGNCVHTEGIRMLPSAVAL